MYVDHHDEAYRWCANKQFEAHGSLGTLQVFDVNICPFSYSSMGIIVLCRDRASIMLRGVYFINFSFSQILSF